MQNSKFKIQKIKVLIFILLSLIFAGAAKAQDFGIYDLSAKTNLDSADIFMISQRVDSAYYKVLWDRVVDSIEDSIKGNIINAWIKSGANIALNKLASGTAGYIVMANVSGVPTYTAVSGDGTISNAGVLTISSNAIGSSEITDGSIVNADVNSSAAIVYSKLSLTNSIVSGDITDGTITTNDILDGTITTSDISDGTITTTDISDGTITNTDISTSAAIAVSKLASTTAGYVLIGGATGTPSFVKFTGDVSSVSGLGAVDLADNLSDNFNLSGNVTFTSAGSAYFDGPLGLGIDSLTATNTINITAPVIVLYEAGFGMSISAFTGGVHGREVTLIASPSNTENIEINNNATIKLAGGVTWSTMGPRDVIRFINYYGTWIETYRSNN